MLQSKNPPMQRLAKCSSTFLRRAHSLSKPLANGLISSDHLECGRNIGKQTEPTTLHNRQFVHWNVKPEEEGTRLDRLVKRRAPGLPPGLIQKLIRQGRITVDGSSPRRNAYPLKSNSIVAVPGELKLGLTRGKRAPPPDDSTLAEAFEIQKWVLHRDARCVVLNKPAGIPTQGGGPSKERHIEAMLPGIGSGRYWLVHRLDREVSGALVVARDVGAAALLAEHFKERRVSKTYWALVRGRPLTPSGVITAPINGKNAFTEYKTLASVDSVDYTLLELKPRTGRKHQLRIHCADVLGTPVVGDVKYSTKAGLKSLVPVEERPARINLHACRIEFPTLTKVHHGGAKPQLGRVVNSMVDVEAPLPRQLFDRWQMLGVLPKSEE